MYASDLTHQKRAAAVFRNLQLQKEWFSSGGTIRILGQKGGNDYSYMTHVEEGCVANKCWQLYVGLATKKGNGPISANTSGMLQLYTEFRNSSNEIKFRDYKGDIIYDAGYGAPLSTLPGTIDDAFIPIPPSGMDFFFNNVNYGNSISWHTNNVLVFGPGFNVNLSSVDGNQLSNAILMGNYDRLCSNLFYSSYVTEDGKFSIIKLIVTFSDYYTDTTNLATGKLQIRLIRESGGNQRQWVEVGVLSAPPSPGYSNNPTVNYPSGTDTSSGKPIDSISRLIDPTKNSPWDVTNGREFLNVAGSMYSTAFPVAGTTLLYESDKMGIIWTFTPNAYLPV